MTYTAPMRRVDKMAFGKPTHYYVDANNLKIPGVTTILAQGLPKPALVQWAGNTTAAYAVDNWDELSDMKLSDRLNALKRAKNAERDAAAKRGTEIHKIAELITNGEEVAVPEEILGHVESYVRFLDEWEPTVLHTELVVVNYAVGYAGSLDLIYQLPDGRVVLADIKTSRSGIFGETALQMTAYRFAQFAQGPDGEEIEMPEVDECHALWIRADGYSVYRMRSDASVFNDFRRVQQTARLMDRLDTFKSEELAIGDV